MDRKQQPFKSNKFMTPAEIALVVAFFISFVMFIVSVTKYINAESSIHISKDVKTEYQNSFVTFLITTVIFLICLWLTT